MARRRDLVPRLATLVAPLALTACLGVTDTHSVLVKPVPVQLLFRTTPTPAPATPAPPTPAPPTPAATPRAHR